MWVWVMDGRATHSQSQSKIFSNSQSRRSELTRDARPELGDPRHLTMYSDIQDACAITIATSDLVGRLSEAILPV